MDGSYPLNKLELLRFDLLHGMPTAITVLRAELVVVAMIQAIVAFLFAGLRDPFRELKGESRGPMGRFTGHQLRPVLLLNAVLRRRQTPERVMAIIGRAMLQSGVRFVRHNVEHPDSAAWQKMSRPDQRAFGKRILLRFGNAETELVDIEGHDFAFNVTRCHFVSLTHRLKRPELAQLFCGADWAYYGAPSVPITLTREQTQAKGDAICTSRFKFQQDDA